MRRPGRLYVQGAASQIGDQQPPASNRDGRGACCLPRPPATAARHIERAQRGAHALRTTDQPGRIRPPPTVSTLDRRSNLRSRPPHLTDQRIGGALPRNSRPTWRHRHPDTREHNDQRHGHGGTNPLAEKSGATPEGFACPPKPRDLATKPTTSTSPIRHDTGSQIGTVPYLTTPGMSHLRLVAPWPFIDKSRRPRIDLTSTVALDTHRHRPHTPHPA